MQHGTDIQLPTDKILARKADGIGWLTFNQPERRNAISLAMWDAVTVAVEADISEFEKVRGDADAEAEYARHSARARDLLAGLEVPLIAMIQGFCIGGGLATALQADLRIASSDSPNARQAATAARALYTL